MTDINVEAKRFFELCHEELHDVVCYCLFGTTVSAAAATRIVRVLLSDEPKGFWSSLGAFFIPRPAARYPTGVRSYCHPDGV